MKKLILGLWWFFCLSISLSAQVWTFESNFLGERLKGLVIGGIVVDPDGKIWVCTYYNNDSLQIAEGGVWKKTKSLWVFNPDGTPAAFSPVRMGTFDGVADTLFNAARGLALDNNGNILYSAYDELFRFNYQTGEGMNKVVPKPATSLTEAAATSDGYIIVGHVAGGNPIHIFNANFGLYSLVEDTNLGLQRSLVVSPDGKDVYVGKIYSGCNGVVIYHGNDGVNGTYERIDTVGTIFNSDGTVYKNMWSQCLDWDRNGLLWVGTYWDVGPNDFTGLYALDPTQGFAIVDSIGHSYGKFVLGTPNFGNGAYYSPRGTAWTADGHTAYVADFEVGSIMRFTNPDPIKPGGGGGGGETFLPDHPIDFKLRVAVTAGSLSDNGNFAGAAYNATEGYDYGLDLPEPPPPFQNYVQLYFPHPEWGTALTNFASDLQEPVNLNYFQKTWNFKVATDQVGQVHTISVYQVSGYGLGNHLFLKNGSSGEIVRLFSGGSIEFTPATAGEYSFQLFVGRLYPVQEISKSFPAGWNMLSLPLTPISNSINDLIGDDVTGYFYPYTYSNLEGYSNCSKMQLGKGYWLGLLDPATIDVAGDSVYDTIAVFLPKGSILIGNPFKYRIGKSNLAFTRSGTTLSFTEAVANQWISGALHHWNNVGSGMYVATDTLSPWWGAWLYVLTDGVSMEIRPGSAKSLLAKSQEIENDGWQVQLHLASDWSGEESSLLGVHSHANAGFDASFDYPEPPPSPNGKFLQGFFRHPRWTEITDCYDRDIRPPENGTALVWDYTVSSSQKGAVRLTWNLENVPSETPLRLSCPELNLQLDMRQQSEYVFNYERELTFQISTGAVTDIIPASPQPEKFALSQNYPNPFNPITTIRYQLPKACQVELTVYNALGQTIQTLVSNQQPAGYYSVSFDANRLGSGIYFYCLKAGEFQELRKCVVVK